MNRHHDDRFHQLLALANEGDECAIADLYAEYGYEFPMTGKTETKQHKGKGQDDGHIETTDE